LVVVRVVFVARVVFFVGVVFFVFVVFCAVFFVVGVARLRCVDLERLFALLVVVIVCVVFFGGVFLVVFLVARTGVFTERCDLLVVLFGRVFVCAVERGRDIVRRIGDLADRDLRPSGDVRSLVHLARIDAPRGVALALGGATLRVLAPRIFIFACERPEQLRGGGERLRHAIHRDRHHDQVAVFALLDVRARRRADLGERGLDAHPDRHRAVGERLRKAAALGLLHHRAGRRRLHPEHALDERVKAGDAATAPQPSARRVRERLAERVARLFVAVAVLGDQRLDQRQVRVVDGARVAVGDARHEVDGARIIEARRRAWARDAAVIAVRERLEVGRQLLALLRRAARDLHLAHLLYWHAAG